MADEEKSLVEEEGKKAENLKKDKGQDKFPKEKPQKLSKTEKKALKQKEKEKKKAYDEWEEGISKNKRVKSEELRKKVKRAMLILLTFSMIATSVVYSTLLFIEENNVRITATSNEADKGLSLSMDNSIWSPYLNGRGPEYMGDITYNPLIDGEFHPWTTKQIEECLVAADPVTGNRYEDNYIAFMFMLKNVSKEGSLIACELKMDVEGNAGIENAIRVMWGTSFSSHPDLSVRCFASLSDNDKLKDLAINKTRTKEEGYLEYCAYPFNRNKEYLYKDDVFEDYNQFEEYLDKNNLWTEAEENGYFVCEPFYSDEFVFKNDVELEKGEVMYCYIQIWLEGSDYDCVDSIYSGAIKMGLNFTVVA